MVLLEKRHRSCRASCCNLLYFECVIQIPEARLDSESGCIFRTQRIHMYPHLYVANLEIQLLTEFEQSGSSEYVQNTLNTHRMQYSVGCTQDTSGYTQHSG